MSQRADGLVHNEAGVVNNLLELGSRFPTLLRCQLCDTPKVNRLHSECVCQFEGGVRGEHLNGLASITNTDSTNGR